MTRVLAVVSTNKSGKVLLNYIILVVTGTILKSKTWSSSMSPYKLGQILDNKDAEKCCHKCAMEVWPASLTHALHNKGTKKCFCLGIRKLLIRNSHLVYTTLSFIIQQAPSLTLT